MKRILLAAAALMLTACASDMTAPSKSMAPAANPSFTIVPLGVSTCTFTTVELVNTLDADCTTDQSIIIPDGETLEGAHHTITAIDPVGGHFVGGVIKAAWMGTATVRNVMITTAGLTGCEDGSSTSTNPQSALRGILFDHAGGSITGNTISNINRGVSGCQEGNAIDVTNVETDNVTPSSTKYSVEVSGNTVTNYQKTGIRANGNVAATISGNTVTGLGHISYIAQNGIQVGRSATAIVKNNTVSGNFYTGPSWVSCGLLYLGAGGVKASANTLFANQIDQCNAGKGGGKFNSN